MERLKDALFVWLDNGGLLLIQIAAWLIVFALGVFLATWTVMLP